MVTTVLVNKESLKDMRRHDHDIATLVDGAVRLEIESFSVTANNVTYAVIGNGFRYWDFFPSGEQDWGIVPMWGHARVAESTHADIAVGERVYGYLPMASHLDVHPDRISASGFTDAAAHRQAMSPIYNQYSRLTADPEHQPGKEAERMIFGPLFKTGFLIEAMFRRSQWFGAEQLVVTSASSKTAMALASVARSHSPEIRRIALTSDANVDFVRETGLYDEVLSYEDVSKLDRIPSLSVDFAGNALLLRAIHETLDDELNYSCLVGATHVENRTGSSIDLPGPAPKLFFAPEHAVAIVKEMGPQAFAEAVANSWNEFLETAAGSIKIEERTGLDAAADAFGAIYQGKIDPAIGIIIRP